MAQAMFNEAERLTFISVNQNETRRGLGEEWGRCFPANLYSLICAQHSQPLLLLLKSFKS